MNRHLAVLGTLAALIILVVPNALADSYSYTTTGCFAYGTCLSDGSSSVNFLDASNHAQATLSYSNIGSTISTSSGSSTSLGSFAFSVLNSGLATYSGTFSLDVLFTAPAGTSSNPFMALVNGNVVASNGGATITFFPSSQTFTYSGGSFALNLNANPVQLSSLNPNVTLYGTIVSNSVTAPEGAGWSMLGMSAIVMFAAIGTKKKLVQL
jgi:hypothetical protein